MNALGEGLGKLVEKNKKEKELKFHKKRKKKGFISFVLLSGLRVLPLVVV